MGLEWINRGMTALQQAGIRTQRGFPAEKLPCLTGPVAAVSLGQAQEGAVTVAVRIYGPAKLGGQSCENMAFLAAEALASSGAKCQIGSCEFDGKTGLFCLPIQASFAWPIFAADAAVQINGETVSNLVRVSTKFRSVRVKTTDWDGNSTVTIEKYWRVELEDILPAGSISQTAEDDFSLVITRSNGTEQYEGCRWESVSTEPMDSGLRRVRVALTGNQPVTAVTE